LLAEQIAEDFCAVSQQSMPSRSVFDQLLLTAHTRTTGTGDVPLNANA
jgi:hypothetical protein